MIRKQHRKLNESLAKNPINLDVKPFITNKTRIFAIGSCFALEIVKFLGEQNYNILNKEISQSTDHNLIWYNTYSILYEFERVVDKFKQSLDDFWKLKNGKYQDPYRRCVFSNSIDGIRKATQELNNRIKNYITTCEVLVITLGLVEIWIKPDNKKVICANPGYPKGVGGGANCTFAVSTYDENLNNMRKVMDIINKVNPCKVLITTSPVPLHTTFRNTDHLIANTESKAILRSVCGQLEREYKNVIYYPAYEMAIANPTSAVFKSDGRHIKPDFVKQIMTSFKNTFVKKNER